MLNNKLHGNLHNKDPVANNISVLIYYGLGSYLKPRKIWFMLNAEPNGTDTGS